MITIEATPAGIRAVIFTSETRWERSVDHLAYRVIQPLVDKIDAKLRRTHAQVLREIDDVQPRHSRPRSVQTSFRRVEP